MPAERRKGQAMNKYKDIKKRLQALENGRHRDIIAKLTYPDGHTETRKMLDLLNDYINSGIKPPIVRSVELMGDTSKQGILPDLLLYYLTTNESE